MDNRAIARRLSDYASELGKDHPNLYRLRAYRWAADIVRSFERPLTEVLEAEGRAGIAALPGVGSHIAFTIEGLIRTGQFRTWRERGTTDPLPACGVAVERPKAARRKHAFHADSRRGC